jgi:hypothetical protein
MKKIVLIVLEILGVVFTYLGNRQVASKRAGSKKSEKSKRKEFTDAINSVDSMDSGIFVDFYDEEDADEDAQD